jgi:rubrerythrin
MPPEQLIFAYFVSLLAALSAVAIYYELRRRRFEPSAAEDNIFRCTQCGTVYTDDADVDRSRCTQCGKMNDSFEF